MLELLNSSKIIICVGSGGVGKTTLAASLAWSAAKAGKKVLILTIDPSRRLKTTMGLSDSQTEAQIFDPEIKGSLTAAVVDPTKTFNEFVARASGKADVAERLLHNKLYQQLSTNLSGSQEFTALEKLYSEYEKNIYDLIVLDTPPTKHAVDFLNAPQKISALFNEGISKWFRDPKGENRSFLTSLIHVGTQRVLKSLELLTGNEFMAQLADFFSSIHLWQGKLEQRTADVHRLLVDPKTRFVLITSFDHAKLKEAQEFAREIRQGGYGLSAVIINRAFPIWLNLEENHYSRATAADRMLREMSEYYLARKSLYQNFGMQGVPPEHIFRVPELENDLSDLTGVKLLSDLIQSQERPG